MSIGKTVLRIVAYVVAFGLILVMGLIMTNPSSAGMVVVAACGALAVGILIGLESSLDRLGRKGRTIALVVVGFCTLVCSNMLAPVFVSARWAAATTQCNRNLRDLATAVSLYAEDHGDRLPPSEQWFSVSVPYGAKPTSCPLATSAYSYAMNAHVSRLSLTQLDDIHDVVLLFEQDARLANASGGKETAVLRHGTVCWIAPVDGTVRAWNPTSEFSRHIRWKP